jgi:nitroreductase
VDEPELKNKVAKETFNPAIAFNKFAPQAPILLAIVLELPKVITQIAGFIKKKKYPQIDVGILAEHICLQAEELGLGTCMLGWFDQSAIQKLLNIPRKREIALIITLGYPSKEYPLRKKIRKDMDDIVTYNTYKT